MKKYVLGILIMITLCLTGCANNNTSEVQTGYKTSEYKVVSVVQYTRAITNRFGGVEEYRLNYTFTYIGDDGQLHQFDEFEHTEYGLWKLAIGTENKYVVVDKGLDTYRYLYLTEETLLNMQKE